MSEVIEELRKTIEEQGNQLRHLSAELSRKIDEVELLSKKLEDLSCKNAVIINEQSRVREQIHIVVEACEQFISASKFLSFTGGKLRKNAGMRHSWARPANTVIGQ